jgi:ADP-ribosylglycohydrolase
MNSGTVALLHAALALLDEETPARADIFRLLGEGWTGDEALAIGVYAACAAHSFEDAIRLAANHDGDSDSTASIAGQLYGARHGLMALPHAWVRQLDILKEALEVTQRFLDAQKMAPSSAHNLTTHQPRK